MGMPIDEAIAEAKKWEKIFSKDKRLREWLIVWNIDVDTIVEILGGKVLDFKMAKADGITEV